MKPRFAIRIFLILLILFLSQVSGAFAQVSPPPRTPLIQPESNDASLSGSSISLFSASKDTFGYSLVEETGLDISLWKEKWVDATACQKSSLKGREDQLAAPVNIGFDFPFYEKTYNKVYFNTEGLLSFEDYKTRFKNTPLPLIAQPNNLVAAFWDDLGIYPAMRPGSGVYYCSKPGYFVVEWHRVFLAKTNTEGSGEYTFEIVLYPNGNIYLLYEYMNGDVSNMTIGIEDSRGRDGFAYLFNHSLGSLPLERKVFLITRPTPARRVVAWPAYQGNFFQFDQVANLYPPLQFTVNVINTGSMGADDFNLFTSAEPDWDVTIDVPGTTGGSHTGSLASGESIPINITVFPPANASVGDSVSVSLNVCSASSGDSACQTATLSAAVPAPFAQTFWDNADNQLAFSLYERTRSGPALVRNRENVGSLSLARHPLGYVYVWDELSTPGGFEVREIKYAMLNMSGEVNANKGIQSLTNHQSAGQFVFDENVAVAAAQNGKIGVAWQRREGTNKNALTNNLYFAILNVDGSLSFGPEKLTSSITPLSPAFDEVRITATTDNHFVIAYRLRANHPTGEVNDIYFQVFSSTGAPISQSMRVTSDAPSDADLYFAPALTGLQTDQFLLVWSRRAYINNVRTYMTYYAIFDNEGHYRQMPTLLTRSAGGRPDVVELPNGRVIVAIPFGMINVYTLEPNINGQYTPSSDPVYLDALACATADNRYVSAAPTPSNQVVLTWSCHLEDASFEGISPYMYELYYALLDEEGGILTQPMIFHSSQEPDEPILHINQHGYANASYLNLQSDVDLSVTAPDRIDSNIKENAVLNAFYANYGYKSAAGVSLTAVLNKNLSLVSASPTPTVSADGKTLTWNLGTLAFLQSGSVEVTVRSPGNYGAYPVQWSIKPNDAYAQNNQAQTLITLVPKHCFLPAITR